MVKRIIAVLLILFVYSLPECICAQGAMYSSKFSFGVPIIDCADRGDIKGINRLISKGVDVDEQGKFGTTALMRAALRGNTAIMKVLLEARANTNLQDIGGATALHLASRSGSKAAVEILVQHQADVNVMDMEGYTPSLRAIQNKKHHILQTLINNGADIESLEESEVFQMEVSTSIDDGKILEIIENYKAEKESPIVPEVILNEKHSDTGQDPRDHRIEELEKHLMMLEKKMMDMDTKKEKASGDDQLNGNGQSNVSASVQNQQNESISKNKTIEYKRELSDEEIYHLNVTDQNAPDRLVDKILRQNKFSVFMPQQIYKKKSPSPIAGQSPSAAERKGRKIHSKKTKPELQVKYKEIDRKKIKTIEQSKHAIPSLDAINPSSYIPKNMKDRKSGKVLQNKHTNPTNRIEKIEQKAGSITPVIVDKAIKQKQVSKMPKRIHDQQHKAVPVKTEKIYVLPKHKNTQAPVIVDKAIKQKQVSKMPKRIHDQQHKSVPVKTEKIYVLPKHKNTQAPVIVDKAIKQKQVSKMPKRIHDQQHKSVPVKTEKIYVLPKHKNTQAPVIVDKAIKQKQISKMPKRIHDQQEKSIEIKLKESLEPKTHLDGKKASQIKLPANKHPSDKVGNKSHETLKNFKLGKTTKPKAFDKKALKMFKKNSAKKSPEESTSAKPVKLEKVKPRIKNNTLFKAQKNESSTINMRAKKIPSDSIRVEKVISLNEKVRHLIRKRKKQAATVSEAVKLPSDTVIPSPTEQASLQHKTRSKSIDLRNKIKMLSMEISGFTTHDQAIDLWQKILQQNLVSNMSIKLLKTTDPIDKTEPKLRIGMFRTRDEIFNVCKKIREIDTKVLCYAVRENFKKK